MAHECRGLSKHSTHPQIARPTLPSNYGPQATCYGCHRPSTATLPRYNRNREPTICKSCQTSGEHSARHATQL